MTQDQRDWWESEEDVEWDWIDEYVTHSSRADLKCFSISFKGSGKGIRSVEIDAASEKDAVNQVLEDYLEEGEKKDFSIVSIIEVDYDER